MISHVAGVEHEPTVCGALLGRRHRDLAVLHHLVLSVDLTDHAHCLGRVGFVHHLQKEKQPGVSRENAEQDEVG